MLKETTQITMDLSPYQGLYEAIIPQDHILRKLKDNIDFSFVNPMLRKQYCEHFGRPAKEPEMMFKLLFLKKLYAELYARTNSAVAAAANAQLEEGFSYSKDAHMMQCPAGYLAMRVEKRNAANGNTYYNYCFSVKKCKACPMRDNCRVGKSKSRTYSVTCANDAHKARLEFESSEEFSNKMRIRHRIEEKNGEMKTAHGFRRADSAGLVAMRLQAYFTAIVVNMKRIVAVIPG